MATFSCEQLSSSHLYGYDEDLNITRNEVRQFKPLYSDAADSKTIGVEVADVFLVTNCFHM